MVALSGKVMSQWLFSLFSQQASLLLEAVLPHWVTQFAGATSDSLLAEKVHTSVAFWSCELPVISCRSREPVNFVCRQSFVFNCCCWYSGLFRSLSVAQSVKCMKSKLFLQVVIYNGGQRLLVGAVWCYLKMSVIKWFHGTMVLILTGWMAAWQQTQCCHLASWYRTVCMDCILTNMRQASTQS